MSWNVHAVTKGNQLPKSLFLENDETGIVQEYRQWKGMCETESALGTLDSHIYHHCKRCGVYFAVMRPSADIIPRACPYCGGEIRQ